MSLVSSINVRSSRQLPQAPNGSSLDRFTISQMTRFAKPLAAPVPVKCLNSSALVMCDYGDVGVS